MKKHNIKLSRHPEKLTSYFKLSLPLMIMISISGILYNLGMLANPYFEGLLVDTISKPETSLQQFLFLILIFVLTILLVQVFRAIKRYLVRRFNNNTVTTIRKTLYNNLMNESLLQLQNENMGQLLTRLQSDCFQTCEGLRKLTTEIFDTVFLFLFYIMYLCFYSVKMTLFALIPVLFAILFAFLMRKKIYQANVAAKKANARLSNETYSLFDHALLFRLYSRDEENLRRYDDVLKDYEKKNVHSELLSEMYVPISNVISLLGLLPIIYLGSAAVIDSVSFSLSVPYVMNGNWTIGALTTYVTTFVLLSSKASHTANLFSSIEKGLSSWKRIKPYIKPYQEYPKKEILQGDSLVLRNFSISTDERVLFHDLNLACRKGEVVALTGMVASGKSYFGKVFLDEVPYSGSAVLFGKEVRDFTKGEIKGNVTYMGHRCEFVSDTIRDNIAYGEEKDVKPYLDMVDFNKDMESMGQKEETLVGNEGVKLSGGQQERIALARTFYHKKGLVILDDPFASVDIKTEHTIMNSLRKEAEDSIILFFSHRLSYFPYCDKIIVINDDGSLSTGTHESLLKDNRTYQELYQLQLLEVNHE